MSCYKMRVGDSVAIVNMAPPMLKINSGGKCFHFEFHHFLGPAMLSKRGDPIQSFPPRNSPFWDALRWWIKQGKRVDADGHCIFEHEMTLIPFLMQFQKPSGRHR
jgi:hypothetical protein